MANAIVMGTAGMSAGAISIPEQRGRFVTGYLVSMSRQLLPTDSVGLFYLELTNVVVGSRYEIESPSGVLVNAIAASSNINEIIPVMPGGSVTNMLVIKVRKASGAPYYQSYETQIVALVGKSASIFVNQVRDDL
jgi:formylmethanofuran dehydrogenase subunit D